MTISKTKSLLKLAFISLFAFIAAKSCAQLHPPQTNSKSTLFRSSLDFSLPVYLSHKFYPRLPMNSGMGTIVVLNDSTANQIYNKWTTSSVRPPQSRSRFYFINREYNTLLNSHHKIEIPTPPIEYTYQYFYKDSPTDLLLQPRFQENFKPRTPEDKLNYALFISGQVLRSLMINRQQ